MKLTKRKLKKLAANIILASASFLFVYPVFIMVAGSFKTAEELSANPAGFPIEPILDNYMSLASSNGGIFIRSIFNSLYVSVVYVVLMLFVTSLAAFAFAKYQFPGKNVIFIFLMMTIMIPIEVLIPPLYVMFAKIGWLSTYTVQIIPGIANVMALFLLRQYMIGIPDSILDAAKMDGAGDIRVFLQVVLPVSIPVLTTVGLLNFMSKWSEYIWPLLMINKSEKMPVMVILPLLSNNEYTLSFQYEYIMAGCVVATLPILILFLIFNKKIMVSVTAGAVKG